MLGPKCRQGGGDWRGFGPMFSNSESGGAKCRCSKVITDDRKSGSAHPPDFQTFFAPIAKLIA